jgi:molybdate transport system substrate-binding protein
VFNLRAKRAGRRDGSRTHLTAARPGRSHSVARQWLPAARENSPAIDLLIRCIPAVFGAALLLTLSHGSTLAAAPGGAASPTTGVSAGTVTIAAASDLIYCLDALHAGFRAANPGVTVKASTGSSGNFFAQLSHGAPYDVFLSADVRYPRELVAAGAADGPSLTLYAIGRVVVWTLRKDLDLANSDLSALLRRADVRRFAIANPTHAPYGRAAQETLEKAGAWMTMQPKLVLGENIAQTAQFIQTGHADAGIVALSLVLAPALHGVGHWVEIPDEWHAPLEQAAVLTIRGKANPAAMRYLEFLRSPAGREIFERFGFRLPPVKP